VRLPDIPPAAADALRSAGDSVADFFTPTVRLGVTGFSRAGKTVFITALVRALLSGGRLPFFRAQAQGRIAGAYLEPQPDDAVPRFDYESHIAALERSPPEWPDGTRSISELRITVSYRPSSWLWRTLGASRLHIDIVDYPGEWLIDLAMMEQDFAAWSQTALTLAEAPQRRAAAKPFLDFADRLSADAAQDEQVARKGAELFTAYLAEARRSESALASLSPGRFLLPGDLAGSPLLTFFPIRGGAAAGKRSLGGMLERRYESYKSHVVKPFFRDHFQRIDRQIVLVDALGSLDAGPAGVAELQQALDAVLRAFRPGQQSWLALLGAKRVDRLLVAATKADHLHHTSHDRLEGVLRLIADRAIERASAAGARVGVLALAALRSTREGVVREKGSELPVIIGVPLPGERIGAQVFDGREEAAVFPGDLPADPEQALAKGRASDSDDKARRAMRFVRFRPARLAPATGAGETAVAPHIRLDRAIEFLVGDKLL
jgi:predicted YcjX-like family ATPase